MLVIVLGATTVKAQSHFSALDQVVSVQFASLDIKESFMDKLVPDFKRDSKVALIEEPSKVLLKNLAPAFNVTNWTIFYKKKVSVDSYSKGNEVPSLVKSISTAKLNFLGYPLSPLTARQPYFEEPGLINNTVLVYHF
ncbi:MAG: hypothetical protein H7Y10_07600 [Flavobacterium sp.]|nr:hypothetical protein [Flavobacterium sp.]